MLPEYELTPSQIGRDPRTLRRYHRDISNEPLTTLRGARVEADPRRIGQAILVICLVSLAVSVVALYVAGVHQNDQIAALKTQGVRVTETVTGCQGLLGGSGSNPVGYDCEGTFTFNGHTYNDPVPGSQAHDVGAKVVVVADRNNPGLVSSVSQVNGEHTSVSVYVIPTLLLIALVLALGIVITRWRRSASKNPRKFGVFADPEGSDGPLLIHGPTLEGTVGS
ncbi:MAG: hypothetical protein WAM97_05150 [Acidimicrobiales bacterium]